MIIHEVLTGKVPFTSWKHHTVMRKVTDGELPGMVYEGLVEESSLYWEAHTQNRPYIEYVRKRFEPVLSTGKPVPHLVDEGVGNDENDWNLVVLTVRILLLYFMCLWKIPC